MYWHFWRRKFAYRVAICKSLRKLYLHQTGIFWAQASLYDSTYHIPAAPCIFLGNARNIYHLNNTAQKIPVWCRYCFLNDLQMARLYANLCFQKCQYITINEYNDKS